MLRRVLLMACAFLLNACENEGPDCNPPVEAYCAESGRCDGMETLEDAFATVLAEERDDGSFILLGSEVVMCGDRVRVRIGNGLVGVLYIYDGESGELVGATPYSDVDEDDGCPGLKHWGEPLDSDCDDGCLLFNDRVEDFFPLMPACDGELAEPFTAVCEARAAADDACAACACTACYPFIAGVPGLSQEIFPGYYEAQCLREQCEEPCAAVLPAR